MAQTKEWKDMTAGEKAAGGCGVFVLLGILLVVLSTCLPEVKATPEQARERVDAYTKAMEEAPVMCLALAQLTPGMASRGATAPQLYSHLQGVRDQCRNATSTLTAVPKPTGLDDGADQAVDRILLTCRNMVLEMQGGAEAMMAVVDGDIRPSQQAAATSAFDKAGRLATDCRSSIEAARRAVGLPPLEPPAEESKSK